jgi:hypothetical protein
MNNLFSDQIKVKTGNLKVPFLEDIRTSEEKLNFKLPPSYLNFIKKFGWGVLCNLFLISIPSPNTAADLIGRSIDGKKIISDCFEMGFWDLSKLSKEKGENLFVFGASENGDLLCWDLENGNEDGEFPIWFLGDENEVVGKIADNLYDFDNNFCINQEIDKHYSAGGDRKWNLPLIFKPLD